MDNVGSGGKCSDRVLENRCLDGALGKQSPSGDRPSFSNCPARSFDETVEALLKMGGFSVCYQQTVDLPGTAAQS
jgi:hypothetical protein